MCKPIHKVLALSLTVLLLVSCLTACSVTISQKDDEKKEETPTTSQTQKDEDNENSDKNEDKNEDKKPETDNNQDADGFWFYQNEHVELGTPDKTVSPQNVYDNLTYIPEMFHGRYTIQGGDQAQKQFAKDATYSEYVDPDYTDGRTMLLSDLPFCFEAGSHTLSHYINKVEDHNWMRVYFMRRSETEDFLDFFLSSYTVEGNTLTLRLIDEFHVDEENKTISYTFSDIELEYEFSFTGRQLTLSNGENKVTLWSGMDYTGENDNINVENYLTKDSQSLGDIDYLSLYYDGKSNRCRMSVDSISGDRSYSGIALMEENGRITITIPWEESDTTVTYQGVYFLCAEDGIVLADGTNVYIYSADIIDRYKSDLNDFVSEDQTGQMDELSDVQIEQVVQTKEDLLKELEQAFEDEGISVVVDANTGEMAMDASILFGGDSAELTDAGKDFIRRFVKVYTTVTANEKYKNFISHTMVEGHTAPVGNSTYEEGLPLSEERAEVVKNYCLSLDDNALTEGDLEAIGYSNSKPIKDKDGNVDMAASRRVSFRFIIDLENFFN